MDSSFGLQGQVSNLIATGRWHAKRLELHARQKAAIAEWRQQQAAAAAKKAACAVELVVPNICPDPQQTKLRESRQYATAAMTLAHGPLSPELVSCHAVRPASCKAFHGQRSASVVGIHVDHIQACMADCMVIHTLFLLASDKGVTISCITMHLPAEQAVSEEQSALSLDTATLASDQVQQ